MKKQLSCLLALIIIMWFIPITTLSQPPEGEFYIVQHGDWLSKLADKYYSDPLAYPAIVEATNVKATEDESIFVISDPDYIEIGQKLWIPSRLPSDHTKCSSTFTALPIEEELLQAQNLSTLIANLNLPTDTLPSDILNQQVVKKTENGHSFFIYEILDNGCTLWLVDDTSSKLHLLKFDKNSRKWSNQVIDGYLGQFIEIKETKNFYLIDTHINPSAGMTVILSQDMKTSHILEGYIQAVYDDDLMIYGPNNIHFAPTHPTKIGIYNPFTQETKTILPQNLDPPLWAAHVEKMNTIYEQLITDDWCARNNHHCKPEWFTRYFGGVTVNSTTDSLAFFAHFVGEGPYAGPYELSNGQIISIEAQTVVYVFREIHSTNQLDYREFDVIELEQIYGEDFELAKLLEKETMDQLFGTE